jgi:uncharacterized protein (TIGR02246 family)
MRRHTIFFAAFLTAAIAAPSAYAFELAQAQPAPAKQAAANRNASETAEVAGQFARWNAALQTHNPDAVAALYAKDAVLLPTLSNQVRTSPAAIKSYFEHFLELKPKGTINQQNIRLLGPDLAINAGIYTFDIEKDGKPSKVQARYDFVYHREGGHWLIVDHHSSLMPEDVAK